MDGVGGVGGKALGARRDGAVRPPGEFQRRQHLPSGQHPAEETRGGKQRDSPRGLSSAPRSRLRDRQVDGQQSGSENHIESDLQMSGEESHAQGEAKSDRFFTPPNPPLAKGGVGGGKE